jgi:hypothetical protein
VHVAQCDFSGGVADPYRIRMRLGMPFFSSSYRDGVQTADRWDPLAQLAQELIDEALEGAEVLCNFG